MDVSVKRESTACNTFKYLGNASDADVALEPTRQTAMLLALSSVIAVLKCYKGRDLLHMYICTLLI
jgi:hypothetical protein